MHDYGLFFIIFWIIYHMIMHDYGLFFTIFWIIYHMILHDLSLNWESIIICQIYWLFMICGWLWVLLLCDQCFGFCPQNLTLCVCEWLKVLQIQCHAVLQDLLIRELDSSLHLFFNLVFLVVVSRCEYNLFNWCGFWGYNYLKYFWPLWILHML